MTKSTPNKPISTLEELGNAIDQNKSFEYLAHSGMQLWERYDIDSYVLRDIKKMIKNRHVRIKVQ